LTKPVETITEDQANLLEGLLEILSNDFRRKIIKILAREDSYMAALATELETTPQALVKHLRILIEKDIIKQYTLDDNTDEQPYSVRADVKDDKKIKYYALNKNVNLRINFGLGIGLEIQGQIWDTSDFEKTREETRSNYNKILEDFVNIEDYIRSQLDETTESNDHLKNMSTLLDRFDDLEKFLIIEKQLILIKKLKTAVGFLADENCIELRPMFFELLKAVEIDVDKLNIFEDKIRNLLPEKATETMRLIKSNYVSDIEEH
jgi:predicted transcriptional regulator